MIKTIEITNYKSIENLTVELGQVTVLIGENGSGKSNILEAIALASAAANEKLGNEFLIPRGIRVTEPQLMRAGFDKDNMNQDIKILLKINGTTFYYELTHDNKSYSVLVDRKRIRLIEEIQKEIERKIEQLPLELLEEIERILQGTNDVPSKRVLTSNKNTKVTDFLIYAPENTTLRNFHEEGQIQPLGVKGEGLFKLLSVMSREPEKGHFAEVKAQLQLFDWFDDFDMPNNLFPGERRLQIKDRYLDETIAYFDQRSANEGFLYLLFYFTLFISDYTPQFFAIDNIDASLNPKLCQRLIQELVTLAKKHGKQVIMTTHNPAILDGLDLTDEAQKLHVVYRNLMGQTKVRPVAPAQPPEGEAPIRLSEAFLKGYLGGLPQNF